MILRAYIPAIFGTIVAGLLGGCINFAELPSGSVRAIVSPVVERQADSVSLPEPDPPPSLDYLIGINDTVVVSTIGGDASGSSRVDGNGNIQLPVLGLVKADGFTTEQLSKNIGELLKIKKYYADPWVVVQVANYQSKPLYLVGEGGGSSTTYMDRPLTLLEGIAKVGITAGNGNIKRAQLLRNKRLVPVDIYSLVAKGDIRQNVWLKPGDTIFIPDKKNMQVIAFGAASGSVPTNNDGTLPLDRLMAQLNPNFVRSDLSRVRVIRSLSTTSGELIIVDFEKTMRGEALPFILQDGDLVYIPRSKFSTWNDAFAEVTPAISAVSTVLQPYVTLKYLFRNP